MNTTANIHDVMRVINADHSDPFNVLGIHKLKSNSSNINDKFVIRAFSPNAKEINVIEIPSNDKYQMEKVHESGLFQAVISDKQDFFRYKFEITDHLNNNFSTFDPYCFLPIISEYDQFLFNEGTHYKIYDKLGAHIQNINGIEGTFFAVWAPCAKRVSVVGNFNQWDGRVHQMRCLGCSGIWELFIPGIGQDEIYKYEIKTCNDEIYIKSDPYAFYSELRPNTASTVFNIDNYEWNDSKWLKQRENISTFDKPMSIYELHLGSWDKTINDDDNGFYTYRQLADKLVEYVKDIGFTHIELMPIAEHPFDGSWGYQLTGYYSVTSRYGTPEDFMYFIDKCHQNNIGVILDWVPAHFPKDGHGLARFDGSALYEHFDKKQGEHVDWGTHIFNYGRHEVKNFLIGNALFWLDKYHIDGLRVDAVASMLYLDYAKKDGEWIPNEWGGKENVDAIEFMRQLNCAVFKYFPNIMMIAEESTAWSLVSKPTHIGGLGFAYKWNMGWMNDFLRYVSLDPIYRKYHHNLLTFSMVYAYSENFILVLSHDEVVHGKCSMINKMPGDYWQKFAGLRASYGFMFGHPGKKLMFMGNEFGQFIEWNYKHSLDWNLLEYPMHQKLKNYVKDLNTLYKNERSLHEIDFSCEGFEWIDCNDSDHSIISFIRKAKDSNDFLIFVCNFTPEVHDNYRIGVPVNKFYKEIFNSDSEYYGGSNVGNFDGIQAENIVFHNRPHSINIKIPPLAIMILKPI